MSKQGETTSTRLTALDGLRGILAMMVVLHHCMSTVDYPATFHANPLLWIVSYTPLHLLWPGTQAVNAFFVLSGFVLVWPFRRDGRRATGWTSWYVHRLARLYLPIWAALLLAYVMLRAVSRPVGGVNDWVAGHSGHVSGLWMIRDFLLVTGREEVLNAVIWSLQWEVLFSLVLPLVVIFLRTRRPVGVDILVATVGLLAIEAGSVGLHYGYPHTVVWQALDYGPMFLLGAMLAEYAGMLFLWMRFVERRWPALAIFWAASLLAFLWPVLKVPSLGDAVPTVGAAALVLLFAFTRMGSAIGNARLVAWLGARSFSIYLVHFPIIMSLAFHIHATRFPWLLLAVGPLASVVAAAIFYRYAERPLHHVARRLGAAVRRPAPDAAAFAPVRPTRSLNP